MQGVIIIAIAPYVEIDSPLFDQRLDDYAMNLCSILTMIQRNDLQHLAMWRKCGLCASRGYGKTLLVAILDTYYVEQGWRVVHLAKRETQLLQYYVWLRKLGWVTTKWIAYHGQDQLRIGLYCQGVGDRCDVISADETGTVVTDLEKLDLHTAHEMLSGSPFGKRVWTGTCDPASLYAEIPHLRVRGYDPKIMPWVTKEYEDAKLCNPISYMDQQYHCKPTPLGGLIMLYVNKSKFPYHTQRYGIDVNSVNGYYIIGVYIDQQGIYITSAHHFDRLEIPQLEEFMRDHSNIEFEIEANGQGMQLMNQLEVDHIRFTRNDVTQHTTADGRLGKTERCAQCGFQRVFVPDDKPWSDDVISNLTAQIWKNGLVDKENDAHWFDAFWHAVNCGKLWIGSLQSIASNSNSVRFNGKVNATW